MGDKSDDIEPSYIAYPEELFYRCPVCGQPVQHCFPSSKHDYRDFVGMVREVRYQYRCLNESCELAGLYFNPSPARVLPYKQFSLRVWKWIAMEAKVFNEKPSEIVFRAWRKHGIKISENTVRNIIDEIDVYVSGKIDENTKKIISEQGCILLAMDGQDPEKASTSLWMFTDVISNRVLAIDLLETADHETLHGIIENIKKIYTVPIVGFISDKQGSIVKMHDTYYPDIPHQYCQFHFLQNMWNYLEAKDSHVNKELSKSINDLYIVSTPKSTKVQMNGIGKVSVRDHFKDLADDLKKIARRRTKKFDKLRGITAFKKLQAYTNFIEGACLEEDENRRDVKILLNTARKLQEGLDAIVNEHEISVSLFKNFTSIRLLLGDPAPSKETKVILIDACFQEFWDRASGVLGILDPSDLRTFPPSFRASKEKIMLEWYRLYTSYRRGLFAYYEFPVPERTNSKMEAKFSKQKRLLFAQCGRKKVGSQVRKRGEYILKQLHVKNGEIESIIDIIPGNIDDESVKEGLRELEMKIKKESESWYIPDKGKDIVKKLLERGKSSDEGET